MSTTFCFSENKQGANCFFHISWWKGGKTWKNLVNKNLDSEVFGSLNSLNCNFILIKKFNFRNVKENFKPIFRNIIARNTYFIINFIPYYTLRKSFYTCVYSYNFSGKYILKSYHLTNEIFYIQLFWIKMTF